MWIDNVGDIADFNFTSLIMYMRLSALKILYWEEALNFLFFKIFHFHNQSFAVYCNICFVV